MARAQAKKSWNHDSNASNGADWRALRADLVDLLEQVESQAREIPDREIPHSPQDNPPAHPESGQRRQQALKSVRQAVDRFSEPEPIDQFEHADDEFDASQAADQQYQSYRDNRPQENAADVLPVVPPQNQHDDAPSNSVQSQQALLQSAIQQIRARTEFPSQTRIPGTARQPLPVQPAPGQPVPARQDESRKSKKRAKRESKRIAARSNAIPHGYDGQFGELTGMVSGMGKRLEQLEKSLQKRGDNRGEVAEIANQVAQLTHVVELLSGAVGESGQVKRLEAQITKLAQNMGSENSDVSLLGSRLDEIAATVDRLAEMQVQQMGRDARDQSQAGAEQIKGINAIEQGVRSIYDRLDTLEESYQGSPQDLERVAQEIADFTTALRSGESAQGALLQRLDALNAQVSQLQNMGEAGPVNAMQADVAALRDAVSGEVGPRFQALESQIAALGKQVATTDGSANADEVGLQIRQLIARMDETGEQLSGLTKLYQDGSSEPTTDYEALAALVARRTSEEIGRGRPDGAGLSIDSLNSLEGRLSELFKSGNSSDGELNGVKASIQRVDDRLERLEAVLIKLSNATLSVSGPKSNAPAQPVKTEAASAAAPSASPPSPEARATQQQNASPAARIAVRMRNDAMPSDPNEARAHTPQPSPAPAQQAPSNSPTQARDDWERADIISAQGQPSPPLAALDRAGQRGQHAAPQQSRKNPAQPTPQTASQAPGKRPGFNPENIDRPERPKSSFDTRPEALFESEQASATPPIAGREHAQNVQAREIQREPSADSSTFIAAARRAAINRPQPSNEPESRSLIGKAFARFQRDSSEQADEPSQHPDEAKKSRWHRNKKTGQSEVAAQSLPGSAMPTELDNEEFGAEKSPSFLSRHKKPLLLSVALVGVSLLTLNLVTQRMGGADPAPSTSVAPAMENSAPSEAPFTPEPMIDPAPTGSIDPFIEMDLTRPTSRNQPLPLALSSAALPNRLLSNQPIMGQKTDISNMATGSIVTPNSTEMLTKAPVQVAMPPEAIGPVALRQAAADGDPRAQFEVAAIFTEGKILTQDYKSAAIWYERAAARGFAPAQYRLGNLFEHGTGVDKDLEQARLWYQRAAEVGNRMSMHNLAALYASGALGEQKFPEAAEWFQRAAERGIVDSQFNLGMLHARGLGVPQSLADSYKWFSLAADRGDKDASKAREDVARSLDAETVQSLQRELAQWEMTPIDIAANFAPIGTWATDFDPGQTITKKQIVEQVQAVLSRLGYNVGKPDGVMGPKTMEAIRSFERAAGMPTSGMVNPRLLAVLGSQPV